MKRNEIAVILILIIQFGCGGKSLPLEEDESEIVLTANSSSSPKAVVDPNSSSHSKELTAEGQNGAERLGVRIVPQKEGDNFGNQPDPLFDLNRPSPLGDVTIEGNKILFHSKLFLADPRSPNREHRKELYFVWPENSLGSPLRSATYSLQVKNTNFQDLGNLRPFSVWHDTENHRWFIPLSELYQNREKYGPEEVSPAHTQILTLELTPANGPNQTVQIQFQAVGPFPKFRKTVLPLENRLGSAEDFIRTVSREGFKVRSEEVFNPTLRPFNLWVKTLPGGPIEFVSYLRFPQYIERTQSPPEGPTWKHYRSKAVFEDTKVVVTHQSGKQEEVEFEGGLWKKIRLLPFETLRLDWWVKPSRNARDCSLPFPQTEVYHWVEPPQRFIEGRGLNINVRVVPSPPQSRRITLDWSFLSANLQGEILREIQISHFFDSDEEARESLDWGREKISIHSTSGTLPAQSEEFNCNGIFR